MKSNVNYLNVLLTAFESRNEVLHEEIQKNEEAIKKVKEELSLIESNEVVEVIDEK